MPVKKKKNPLHNNNNEYNEYDTYNQTKTTYLKCTHNDIIIFPLLYHNDIYTMTMNIYICIYILVDKQTTYRTYTTTQKPLIEIFDTL